MSIFDKIKRGLGIAAMTSPTTAIAWKAYQEIDKGGKGKKAPPKKEIVDSAPSANSDEAQVAVQGGYAERAHLRRVGMSGARSPYYFPPFISVGDDDDLKEPDFTRTVPRREGRGDLRDPDRLMKPIFKNGKKRPSDNEKEKKSSASVSGGSGIRLKDIPPGSLISNDTYRAIVWRHAKRLSGGARPSASSVMTAQSKVQSFLSSRNIGISIPGSRPGRRTV